MVQIVENLSRIDGRIVARRAHARLDDYDVVTVELGRVEAVAGKADLLAPLLGKVIEIAVRRSLLADAAPGASLHCRAKRTADGAMCEAHPEPNDFAIQR